MKQTDPQFKLRLPSRLKERLDAAAGYADRTLTAEIVDRLERSFVDEARRTDAEAIAEAVAERLVALIPRELVRIDKDGKAAQAGQADSDKPAAPTTYPIGRPPSG